MSVCCQRIISGRIGLAVPRRRLLGAAVDLVEPGLLVAVLAARDQPRADDLLVLVDGPHPLALPLVHDPLARARSRPAPAGRRRRPTTPTTAGSPASPSAPGGGGGVRTTNDSSSGQTPTRDRRLPADDAVDEQRPLLLQRLDRGVGGVVERAGRRRRRGTPALTSALLEARDVVAAVAERQRVGLDRAVLGAARSTRSPVGAACVGRDRPAVGERRRTPRQRRAAADARRTSDGDRRARGRGAAPTASTADEGGDRGARRRRP